MASVLLIYFAVALLGALGLFGIWYYLKNVKKVHIYRGLLLVGFVVSIVYYVLELLLFTSTFGDNIDYYNTLTFRVVVGFLFLVFFCLVRVIITKKVFFNARLKAHGLSFYFGFAGAWAALFALYLFVLALVLSYYGIFVGLESVTDEYLAFSDGTKIMVFRPLIGHLSFGVFFVALGVIGMASASLLAKLAEKRVRPFFALVWVILLMILETATIQTALYINAIPHWAIALNSAVMAVFCVLLVRFIPLSDKAEEYTKQFE